MNAPSAAASTRVLLLRHGRVRSDEGMPDSLSEEGERLRRALPGLLAEWGVDPVSAFYDKAHNTRCRATVSMLTVPRHGYGGHDAPRHLNEVLKLLETSGRDHLVCYRSESIESGALHHVQGFPLHTPYHAPDYLQRVRAVMRSAYSTAHLIELTNGSWRQTATLPIHPCGDEHPSPQA